MRFRTLISARITLLTSGLYNKRHVLTASRATWRHRTWLWLSFAFHLITASSMRPIPTFPLSSKLHAYSCQVCWYLGMTKCRFTITTFLCKSLLSIITVTELTPPSRPFWKKYWLDSKDYDLEVSLSKTNITDFSEGRKAQRNSCLMIKCNRSEAFKRLCVSNNCDSGLQEN